jgi:hypothetical protein
MQFEIPIDKDSKFAMDFFSLIDQHVSELATDYQKLPSQIIFSGGLGKELHSFIKDKGWSFSGFELVETSGPNQLIFKYNKEIDQVEMTGGIPLGDSSFDGKMIEGVLGQSTVNKIMSGYANSGFKIERKVRPEKIISLTRKNKTS